MLINKLNINEINTSDGYVNIPLSINFSPETQQYENIENSFDLTTSDIVNNVVDYEKVKVYPALYSTGYTIDNIKEVNSLNFALHFNINGNWTEDATKFNLIGFIEDDVKYKRKRLERTFIRLSFYDSMDFKTQNLLYYSTIYVDCDKLYSDYIKSGSTDDLLMNFLIENPKLSNKVKTFEGFNLYLFKDDLSKNETKTIYMRIDFNNALNGRSVLFTKKMSNPLKPNGYTMEELYRRLYFKIMCKFDMNKNKYIGYFDLDEETSENSGVSETIFTVNSDDIYIKNVLNINAYQAKVI